MTINLLPFGDGGHSHGKTTGYVKRMKCGRLKTGALLVAGLCLALAAKAQVNSNATFQLNGDGYFHCGGTDVMAFSDFYPEGHQGGVCVIMNGQRVATNGDIRMEATPGQCVDLDKPVPDYLSGKVGFNLEFFPGNLFGKPWLIRH